MPPHEPKCRPTIHAEPMRSLRAPGLFAIFVLLLCLGGCGNSDPDPSGAGTTDPSSATQAPETPSESASPPQSDPPAADAVSEILGEAGLFGDGGGDATPLDAQVQGRECVLTEALFGSCRASTAVGGAFLVTMESTLEASSVWNVVVRCGTSPGLPAASAMGEFQPMTSDLGLALYGEVVGVTLVGEVAEAALVYQPEGSECPVVWGLGEVDRGNIFTGGLDALNGEASPIAFTDAQGVRTCADADGQGGISVGPCP